MTIASPGGLLSAAIALLGGCGDSAPLEDACPGPICMIETRDGVQLRTWIGLPDPLPAGGVSVVVWRTPYRASLGLEWENELAAFLNARGYGFVFQDVRGRPDSTGTFEAFRHEIEDGQDTTHWIVRQPWSNGRVGMIGGSYDGYTAVAAAVDNPDVRVVISDDGTTDERSERIGGTFSTHTLSWLHLVRTGEWLGDDALRALTNALDPRSMDEELSGQVELYWREALAQDGPGLWPVDGSLEPRFSELCVPTLHVYSQTSGWNDPIDIWRGMREEGCAEHAGDQFLIVTPDPHVFHLNRLGIEATPVNALMIDLLDAYLGDGAVDLTATPRIQWIQHGERSLRPLDSWPAGTVERTLHLAAGATPDDGGLVPSPTGAASTTVDVDPAVLDPCAGDYPVHWYTGAPVTLPWTLAGSPRLELAFEATVPDLDLVVDLYDWNPARTDEPYIPLGWGAVRAQWRDGAPARPLAPGEIVTATISISASAHRLEAGSRLVLSLAPGYCGLLENPQTGEPVIAQSRRQAGTIRVWHDTQHPARLLLPVAVQLGGVL